MSRIYKCARCGKQMNYPPNWRGGAGQGWRVNLYLRDCGG